MTTANEQTGEEAQMVEEESTTKTKRAMKAAVKSATGPDIAKAVASVVKAKSEDKTQLIERDVEIDLVWLSIIGKEHGVFVGTGGVAKSMTVDVVLSHLQAALFKILLRKSMPVEEIFGPLSIKGLENDQFRYITKGRATEANFLFLDEIFKANAVVLNAMLMLINERIFINDGVPIDLSDVLYSVFGASNELPNEPELAAFRDRFAWTKEVKPVQTDDGFKEVLRGALSRKREEEEKSQVVTPVTLDEIRVLQHAKAQVKVGEDVLNDIATMRRRAEGEFNLVISARRFVSGISLCQAQAVLNGRDTVISDDLTLFQHTLWTDQEDSAKAYEVTLDYAGKVARVTQKLRESYEPYSNDLASLRSEIPTDGGAISQEIAGKVATIQMNLKAVHQQVQKQIDEANEDQRDASELVALMAEINGDRDFIRNEILG